MQQSTIAAAKEFFSCYPQEAFSRILYLGDFEKIGSLRLLLPTNCELIFADKYVSSGSQILIEGGNSLPFEENTFDVVVSSSHIEHEPYFWLSFLEILRVLKSDGLFFLNTPTNGYFHRFPSDYWRFYPDAGKAMESWANVNARKVTLVESFVLPQQRDEPWNDFIGIFHKPSPDQSVPEPRLYKRFPDLNNIWLYGETYPIRENKLTEDRRKLTELEYRMRQIFGNDSGLDQPIEIGAPQCNLCGGLEFGAGPGGRMSDSGLPPHCKTCGSLERQRIIRKIFQSFPIGFLDWRRGLQFSADNSVDPSWFRTYEVSIFGGENSLDIQSITREPDTYDFISANHVLEFIPDARLAFDELFRILSQKGIIQISFSAPMIRNSTEDFSTPFGPHGAFHLFGKDIISYFNCASKGLVTLAILDSDPCTGVKEIVHLFIRQPRDAMKIRGWLAVWNPTATILP